MDTLQRAIEKPHAECTSQIHRTIRAALLLVPALLASSGGTAAAEPPTGLCWRSLAPETGPQDLGTATIYPTFTSSGPNEVWMSWEDGGPHILRWATGRWSRAPAFVRPATNEIHYPVVAAAPSGSIIIAGRANGQDGTTALHVARATRRSWEWLGEPLISSLRPFTHADGASVGFLDGGHPVVAWWEERHVELAGLFVARWNGSSWKRLGALSPEGYGYHLSPAVAVDASNRIWLTWREQGRGGLRVARWDGFKWLDVGRDTLQGLDAAQGFCADPSLVVDGEGHPWLLWLASRGGQAGGQSLALARWDGAAWIEVAAPRAASGLETTVWSAAMILHGELPIVAWSQSDDTENHRLFVSQWGPDARWSARLSGLHLVEGVSNVTDVSLAPGDESSFFVSWDEPGKDERRTRLVQAYTCAPGETPASPPESAVERDTWPTTVNEAARRIARELDDETKARVRATAKDDLIQYHHGWGTGIRNSLGLWRGNSKLLESCGQGKSLHPDDCSMIIIEAVWALLQSQR